MCVPIVEVFLRILTIHFICCVYNLIATICIVCFSQKLIMGRGAFIVFEGCDLSGKTTQAKRLLDYLNNIPVEYIKFPNRSSSVGKLVSDGTSNGEAAHLLFSANRWEQKQQIVDAINAGITVVCDRYLYSGIVYSAAKGLFLDWCVNTECGLPRPDVVFYMYSSDPGMMKDRGVYGHEIYGDDGFQLRVSQFYDIIYENNYWCKIDARQSCEDIHQLVVSVTKQILPSVSSSGLQEYFPLIAGNK